MDGGPAFRRIAEAIEAARHSVWLTVTFYAHDFQFADGRCLFDALDDAVARGLDVRVLFWRPNPESSRYGRTFPGSDNDREQLRGRGARFAIRWDRAGTAYCQHQKSWLLDAGHSTETAFVGGINLTAKALGSPGHQEGGQHDVYVEVTGPSATDVHHNFVQRWNEASERNRADGTWEAADVSSLPFPVRSSAPRGVSVVQIQRMVPPGRYEDGSATPGGQPYAIQAGERTILEQYERAIDAARSTIYIENQALPVPSLAGRLGAALQRGVQVVLLVPTEPEGWVRAARRDPTRAALFESIEALDQHENFVFAGLRVADGGGGHAVYVHAKVMLIDDAWATIGSCNLHANSLGGHVELNVSIWDENVVRALRCELLAEHLGQDTSGLDDRAAMRLYGEVACANRCGPTLGVGSPGIAIALNAADYGR
ncbi:phosphatidylserine/phosphatidylglycerophosphate/cardiolipin synthase family protein [Methylobacterium sp. J-030]|uniref:phospholipase D-like domain-containing protein n=1 Tax=Methylobacterium sp. J-030 TaxID=2836627 RepID=UPI001FBA3246|nr:phosphatidylserine/phosphatidylglycerophosphate/cardiolipin synthase family protein [Methylobacterium sp. J-030]MCJ2068257.1 phosphatidylserine/phosphatidylglycerophosphate/cardiolipin synthase family protein [Methylobacterium sp. J-030]